MKADSTVDRVIVIKFGPSVSGDAGLFSFEFSHFLRRTLLTLPESVLNAARAA
jgi:hypothetical protein